MDRIGGNMTQKEKTQKTYEKILNAAMQEFGTKSYIDASLNTICTKHHISKGLIYHNFKNKDALYLCCVKECFNKLTFDLKQIEYHGSDIQDNMKELLFARQTFFDKNPYYSYLFFQVLLQPPKHLLKEIRTIRKEFDDFHLERYRELLNTIQLRDGITDKMAIEYFICFQEMFNHYFQRKTEERCELSMIVEEHERRLYQLFQIMLYGIAKQEETINRKER